LTRSNWPALQIFHYRQMALNKTYRLYLAFGLAVFVHFIVINMEVTDQPTVLPDFHIPRSVNVFLGQKAKTQNDIEKKIIDPVVKKDAKEPVQNKPLPEINTQVPEQAPTAKKPQPVTHEIADIKESKHIQSGKITAPKVPEMVTETAAEHSLASKDESGTGIKLVGALRLARPLYRQNPPPAYPKLARKRGYQGTVILKVLVNSQGRVEDVLLDVSSNHAILDRAALNSVKKWSFEPGSRGDQKTDMWVKVPVTFRLQE